MKTIKKPTIPNQPKALTAPTVVVGKTCPEVDYWKLIALEAKYSATDAKLQALMAQRNRDAIALNAHRKHLKEELGVESYHQIQEDLSIVDTRTKEQIAEAKKAQKEAEETQEQSTPETPKEEATPKPEEQKAEVADNASD